MRHYGWQWLAADGNRHNPITIKLTLHLWKLRKTKREQSWILVDTRFAFRDDDRHIAQHILYEMVVLT